MKILRDTTPRLFAAGSELLLLEPSALDRTWPPFCEPPSEDDDEEDDGWVDPSCRYRCDGPLAIVEINGPLDQRCEAWWWWDGYDAVAKRTCAALRDPSVGAVALRFDSPGGVVAGCFEACDQILAAKAAAGKKIIAVVDECAASAAYALACVADEILLPPTGVVGSVGVIATYTNVSAALKDAGVRVAVMASGKQKADGSPCRPWSDEAVARMQADIDYTAGLFFARVAAARRMTADAVKALEAGVFRGQAGVAAGLADRVLPTAEAYAYAHGVAEKAAAAPPVTTPVRSFFARASTKETYMKSIALTLGMPEEASEAEILAAVVKIKGTSDELVALTGKATVAEALGTVRGWQKTADAYDALVAQVAAEKVAARTAAVEALFASAVATGKRTPAQVEAARASIKAGTLSLDTDEKVAAYKAEIEASPPVLPGGAGGPQPSAEGALVGKLWEEMSRAEKHRLMNDNPAAYKALKEDHQRRTAGKR